MDLEAELIRSSNWSELKRLYSSRVGHAWELAWVQLLQLKDRAEAIKAFQKALRDPHFEQASFVMLWALGAKPKKRIVLEPQSLRLYSAYQDAELRPLAYWLGSDPHNKVFSDSILEKILNSTSGEIFEEELKLLEENSRASASSSFYLGQLWEKKLRNFQRAEECYVRFFQDTWVKKIRMESNRLLFDAELSERIRFAYRNRDGLLLKRLFRALSSKVEKLETKVSRAYQDAFISALQIEDKNLTEHLHGAAFWKQSEWSPRAVFHMLFSLFAPEEKPVPGFVLLWDRFLKDPENHLPPLHLDEASLPLWQIYVELHSDSLSEALLRFPNEERFLFLWSVRNSRKKQADRRQWPALETESDSVRKNLERAFSRSTNKVLWFDRLRASGCSQSFYEFALGEIQIPVNWVLEDLAKNFIKNTASVRLYLKDQLRVVAPSDSESHLLKTKDLQEALNWLTPAEKQEVLLSRFVLVPLPPEILNDEILDLLWDAQSQVGPEVFSSWRRSVLSYLKTFSRSALDARKWVWIESAWENDSKSLEDFSPPVESGPESFPWEAYLEASFKHEKTNLLLTSLQFLKDERLKILWIEKLLSEAEEKNMKRLIQSLSDQSAKSRLMLELHMEHGKVSEALDSALEWMESSAILNEQAEAARWIIRNYQRLTKAECGERCSDLLRALDTLKTLGLSDFSLSAEATNLLANESKWDEAWKVFVEAWWLASDQQKLASYETFLDLSIHARKVEEAQRLLIQRLFLKVGSDPLQAKILESLLQKDSVFQLGHVRREFVERASRIDPLHPEILERRAEYDYRAALLWNCFYSEELKNAILANPVQKKRRYELWGLTQVMMKSSSLKAFTGYLDFYDRIERETEAHDFYDSAKRIIGRMAKHFKSKSKPKVCIRADLQKPLRMCFDSPRIELSAEFFEDLNEDLWTAICVGFIQMLEDRERGLFEEAALIERFFQGTLLSGVPIASVIRLVVWLSIYEGLVSPQVTEFKPQILIQKLPLLNHLLIFYLSEDFRRKTEDCGIQLL